MIKAVKISAIASGFENKEKDEVCEAEEIFQDDEAIRYATIMSRSMTFWTAGSIIMYVYILSLHSQFRDWNIKNPWSFMRDQCVIVMLIRWILIGAGLR